MEVRHLRFFEHFKVCRALSAARLAGGGIRSEPGRDAHALGKDPRNVEPHPENVEHRCHVEQTEPERLIVERVCAHVLQATEVQSCAMHLKAFRIYNNTSVKLKKNICLCVTIHIIL